MQPERRRQTAIQRLQEVLIAGLGLVVAPLLGWLLLQAVAVQKDVVAMRLQMLQVEQRLAEHDRENEESVELHHRSNVRACERCHE